MKEWFSASELVGFSGLPSHRDTIGRMAKKQKWTSRQRAGRGGGYEFHISSLSEETKTDIIATQISIEKVAEKTEMNGRPEISKKASGLSKMIGLSEASDRRLDARLKILECLDIFITNSGLNIDRSIEVFSVKYNLGEIQVDGSISRLIPDVSKATLYRWKRNLKMKGAGGLVSTTKRGRKTMIDNSPELKDFILSMITDFPHISGKQIHRAMTARFFNAVHVDVPSRRSVERYVEQWKRGNAQIFTAIKNPDEYKNTFMTAFGLANEKIKRLNQRWEFDSTPADIMLIDGRHTIVGVIDVYSRRPMMRVARSSASADVAALLRRALLAWGVPEVAKTDNGADYVSKHIKRVFSSLEIDQQLCPPFQPWHKPFIERFFRTFSHDLLEIMPGYIGHNVADRSAIEARMSFSDRLFKKDQIIEMKMTSEELQEFCDDWCDNIYMHSAHSGIEDKTPFQMVAGWEAPVNKIYDERALDILLAPAPGDGGFRTVGKKGIRVDNYAFIHEDLWAHVERRVRVLYDPSDFGRVFVFEGESTEFICIAECPEITGIDRKAVSMKARSMQRKEIQIQKREMKATARKVNTREVVDEILSHHRRKAGELAMFPTAENKYTSGGLTAAGRAADVDGREGAAEEHAPAQGAAGEVLKLVQVEQNTQPVFDNPTAKLRWILEQEYIRQLTEDEANFVDWFKGNFTIEQHIQIVEFVKMKMGDIQARSEKERI